MQDQDSWGGSAGHSAGEVYVFGFNEDDPMESVHCHCAYLHCNGVDICEHLIKISLKAASVMNLILMRCESSGTVSLMLILVKHKKKKTLFQGQNQFFN